MSPVTIKICAATYIHHTTGAVILRAGASAGIPKSSVANTKSLIRNKSAPSEAGQPAQGNHIAATPISVIASAYGTTANAIHLSFGPIQTKNPSAVAITSTIAP